MKTINLNKKVLTLIFIIIFSFFNTSLIFSNFFDDMSKDNEINVDLSDNDESTDDVEVDQTDDLTFGNKWYSKQNFFIFQSAEAGVSGTRDFFSEEFLFKYRFRSKIRHSFALRAYHLGYTAGLFTGNFKYYNFAIFNGFEYFIKLFDNITGFFVWTDFGLCNRGYAFSIGAGLGSRVKNGFDINFTYLHDVGLFSRLNFYFLILKVLTLRGRLGIDLKYENLTMEFFTFLSGAYIGFMIKSKFRLEFGGGFTLNEYSFFNGYGGIFLTVNL